MTGRPATPPTISKPCPGQITTTTFIATLIQPDPARLGVIGIAGLPTGRFAHIDSAWWYIQPREELRAYPPTHHA